MASYATTYAKSSAESSSTSAKTAELWETDVAAGEDTVVGGEGCRWSAALAVLRDGNEDDERTPVADEGSRRTDDVHKQIVQLMMGKAVPKSTVVALSKSSASSMPSRMGPRRWRR